MRRASAPMDIPAGKAHLAKAAGAPIRRSLPGPVTQYERQMAIRVPSTVLMRRQFPDINTVARGAPKRNEEKSMTCGYKYSIVPTRTNAGAGLGKKTYLQQPRPMKERPLRMRHNACTIRPHRSLSVRQIWAGEYFARPDLEALSLIHI